MRTSAISNSLETCAPKACDSLTKSKTAAQAIATAIGAESNCDGLKTPIESFVAAAIEEQAIEADASAEEIGALINSCQTDWGLSEDNARAILEQMSLCAPIDCSKLPNTKTAANNVITAASLGNCGQLATELVTFVQTAQSEKALPSGNVDQITVIGLIQSCQADWGIAKETLNATLAGYNRCTTLETDCSKLTKTKEAAISFTTGSQDCNELISKAMTIIKNAQAENAMPLGEINLKEDKTVLDLIDNCQEAWGLDGAAYSSKRTVLYYCAAGLP